MRRLTFLPLVAAMLSIAACSGGTSPAPAASTAASAPAGAASQSAPAGGASAPAGGASAPAGSAAAGGAACAAAPAGSTATVSVTIKDFKFAPQPVQAKIGDIVGWTNNDSASHSAAMDTAGCATDTLANGATGMLVFNQAGTFTYHCAIHPGQMKDFTVEVEVAAGRWGPRGGRRPAPASGRPAHHEQRRAGQQVDDGRRRHAGRGEQLGEAGMGVHPRALVQLVDLDPPEQLRLERLGLVGGRRAGTTPGRPARRRPRRPPTKPGARPAGSSSSCNASWM